MKYQFFIIAVVLFAIGACKTPYKATDRPGTTTNSTASAMDTTSMNKIPSDSSNMANMDSARTDLTKMDSTSMDSTSQQLPDSAKISSAIDSAQVQPVTDSTQAPVTNTARATPEMDSAQMRSATDSAMTTPAADSAQTNTKAPDAVDAVFTKQYPDATNIEWSAYDSLAAVPVDMRLTGWKKMDAEDHMVKFDFKDESYYAWYDSKGKWIGSATPMEDVDKLPAAVKTAVNKAIKTRYSGYSVSKVNKESQPGKKAYEIELSKDDSKVRMLVSSAGKINQIFKYAASKSE